MKKFLPVLFSCCIAHFVNAQITVDITQSPQQMVEDVFLANGIFVSNVTLNGASAASSNSSMGTFSTGNSTIGIDQGLVMTTGVALDVVTSNASNTDDFEGQASDPDLNALVSAASTPTFDADILEFDFIATGDSLDFIFAFASDEYETFVGSAFNDVFGFFLSGPGISGPYSNSAINIALVPGTSDFVSINTINAGMNSSFFNLNNNVAFGFNGYTDPMHASLGGLVPGETYHIKLAIGDTSDSILDSGVFLSGSSFSQVCSASGPRECLLCSIHANVEYTENCGEVVLNNLSEVNLTTTGCHYDMGDGNQVASCDGIVNYSFTQPGTYEVKLTYELNEFHSTYVVGNIYVSDIPPATPVISQNGNALEVTNWDGISTLQWYQNDIAISGANGSSYVPTTTGAYRVSAINGCLANSDIFNATVSLVGELSKQQTRIYPNPSSGQLNLELPSTATHIVVYNALGQQIIAQNITSTRIQMNLNQGAYVVKTLGKGNTCLSTDRVIIH